MSLLFLDFTGSGFSGLVAKLCITLRVPMDYIACQATLSMVFPRQQYWSGSPFPSSRNLPDSGIKPGSLALQAESFLTEPPVKPSQVALVVTNPPANAGAARYPYAKKEKFPDTKLRTVTKTINQNGS